MLSILFLAKELLTSCLVVSVPHIKGLAKPLAGFLVRCLMNGLLYGGGLLTGYGVVSFF